MRVTAKGQVTIPQDIRRTLGIQPSSEVEFVRSGREVVLRKVRGRTGRGTQLIALMKGKATGKLTTDQIMAMTRGG